MNRALGILFTLGTIVAIVFVALNAGSYTSICFKDSSCEETIAAEENATNEIDALFEVNEQEIVQESEDTPVEPLDSLA